MNCPLCTTVMEKGVLGTDNESWIPDGSTMAALNWMAKPPTFGNPKLWAYRCPNCGKVELTTEVTQVSE